MPGFLLPTTMVGFRSYSLPEWILLINTPTIADWCVFSLLIPSDITAQSVLMLT